MAWLLVRILVAFVPPNLQASSYVQAWVQRYNGPGNGNDQPAGLCSDLQGIVYVTGSSTGSNGLREFATIAYSSAGTSLWTNRYKGSSTSRDDGEAVAVDGTNGNVYVTGESYLDALDNDLATIAYSSSGIPLWTNRYNRPLTCCVYAAAIAVEDGGNVYVAGSAGGRTADYFILAYSSSGGALWTNYYNAILGGVAALQDMVLGADGNVYVAGFTYVAGGGTDYAAIAYSRGGKPLWTNNYNGPANGQDYAAAIASDARGNIYVTGDSEGAGAGPDFATIAYSSNGLPLWTNRYNGPGSSNDIAAAIAVGTDGHIYVTGASYSIGGTYEYATVAYSAEGYRGRLV